MPITAFKALIWALWVCLCLGRRIQKVISESELQINEDVALGAKHYRSIEGRRERLAALTNFLTAVPHFTTAGSRRQENDPRRQRLQRDGSIRTKDGDDDGSDDRTLLQQISDIFFKHKAKFRGGNGGGDNETDDDFDIYGDANKEERDIMKHAQRMIQDLIRQLENEEESLGGDNNKSHVMFFRIQPPPGTLGGPSSGPPNMPYHLPGYNSNAEGEIQALQRRLEAAALPPEAAQVVQRELQHLQRMSPMHSEYSTLVDYLEWIADLPWSNASDDRLVISEARDQLEGDHFGMESVKKRILEQLSVGKLTGDLSGTILCLHGPPGIGKTSLGRSVAKALNRSFYRVALGGVHNEAEIRGHRRTYVSSMPGIIIQALKKCGTNNCVIMLDEIDKLGRHSANGDPYSALLEVLDPEQNQAYRDHYLNIPFNLSRVLFLTTANDLEPIPRPLRDRMEIVEMSGYTVQEKIEIALRHLLPKQRTKHGLDEIDIGMEASVVDALISGYTLEAGVRELERKLAALCRAVAVRLAEKTEKNEREGSERLSENEEKTWTGGVVHEEDLIKVLGPPKFDGPRDNMQRVSKPGIAVGLAYTAFGGDVLFVEAASMDGKGDITITGTLGDVMVESVKIAIGWVRAHAKELGIRPNGGLLLNATDLHIHFPAGAMPKDGPSAGVTITTAIISLLTGRLVRPDLAMTGEITLRGLVLPVGGIKEKLIAAHRAGMKHVIVPEKNEKDVQELPDTVLNELTVHLVKDIDEVLAVAFAHKLDAEDAPSHSGDPISEESATRPLELGDADEGAVDSALEPKHPEAFLIPGDELIDPYAGSELD